jgi:hypothetical protein
VQTPVFKSHTDEIDSLSNSMAATFESYFGISANDMSETSFIGNLSAEDSQQQELSSVAMWFSFWNVCAPFFACHTASVEKLILLNHWSSAGAQSPICPACVLHDHTVGAQYSPGPRPQSTACALLSGTGLHRCECRRRMDTLALMVCSPVCAGYNAGVAASGRVHLLCDVTWALS